jgi:Acetyltransferase (GNAT) domain
MGRHMAVVADCEEKTDYQMTADLMSLAFGSGSAIQPAYLRWLYERGFSCGTTVVVLRSEKKKVGQIALVRQLIQLNGRRELAAQLFDLFIIPGYRGRQSLRTLYDEVERQFNAQEIRFGVGMPNAKAQGVNAHFFNLQPLMTLPFCMGISLSRPRDCLSLKVDVCDRTRLLPLLAEFRSDAGDNGLIWDETRLLDRMSRPDVTYAIHIVGNLLLISSPRRARGLDHTLLCGFFTKPGHRASQSELNDVVGAACRMWDRRVFAYVGINSRLPRLPGIVMPRRIRPSPMMIQLRDFRPDRVPLRFDRYELIDFDYA